LPFLDILLIKRDLHLLFPIYRKPTHNDRYLNFHSCHPMSVKRGVVISLADWAFRIFSQEFLDSELLYLRDILFCNNYQIEFINKIIENRRVKHDSRVIGVSQSSDLNVSKSFILLPYVPGLGEKLSRILRKFNIDTCFQSLRPMGSFFSSGKDLTRGNLVNGVYKIPCFCWKFYIGRTHQQFFLRFIEHRNSIEKP
jgi:hypothetical protein